MEQATKIYQSIIVGTGFSGLCMAIRLKEKGIQDFLILEKAKDLGGTWRENTYPGAECDIPSALYSYSFEPYPYWEYKWSHQLQILEYMKHCAKKYALYPHIHFQVTFTSAKWNAEKGFWSVQTEEGKSYFTRTLITAIGQLHHPSTPNFKGKESLAIPHFHSAQWNHDISLKGKEIGVIGNAASAIQFIPQIAKEAGKVIVFQRSANWMLPKQDRLYRSWEKSLVRQFPFLLKLYRLKLWLLGGALYLMLGKSKNLLRSFYQWRSKVYINKHIKDKDLRQKLIPKYPLGAKRVLFSDDYYEALARENVEVVTENIETILPKGIQTKKGIHELDILIYGTGFKANPFLMGLHIEGENGISIQEAWAESPKSYLGITVSGFPNFFMLYGPNTNLGHNSIIIMSEAQANYIAQAVDFILSKNKNINLKTEVMESYCAKLQERLKHMVWTQVAHSWYQSENGQNPNNYPGRTMEYMRVTKYFDSSKYKMVGNNEY